MTVREPEFSDADRAAWFASHLEEHRPRGKHGIPLDEAIDPAHQYDWVVPLPTTDFAQEKLNMAQEMYAKRKDAGEVLPDPESLLWQVKRSAGTGSPPTET
uniref:hypothetical protein n=1 Tax=Microbacterium proteolyticum TaxID=1572644 RepID=UPI00241748F7|nr:hypothetical protein [Microbacterium proteolyticum]